MYIDRMVENKAEKDLVSSPSQSSSAKLDQV